jgi:4-hydroxy-L-threonine phosphate dehydrogenase PdxA
MQDTDMTQKPNIILLTLGDPTGIGPEVILRALYNLNIWDMVVPICVGSRKVLLDRTRLLGRQGLEFPQIEEIKSLDDIPSLSTKALFIVDVTNNSEFEYSLGHPNKVSGEIAVDSVLTAIDILKNKPGLSLITAPLSKQAIQLGKYSRYKGHKEIFEEQFDGVSTINMIVTYPFSKSPLRLVHVTSHVPLREVSGLLLSSKGIDKVIQTVELTCAGLDRIGVIQPRVAVTGFNPHLEEWEDGMRGELGKEEKHTIVPAVETLRKRGVTISGPITADTAYRRARMGDFDVVVSMFHDQSHIVANSGPKEFSSNIIITMGLPFLRLSTSHGPALDIAHSLKADDRPIRNCIKLVIRNSNSQRRI